MSKKIENVTTEEKKVATIEELTAQLAAKSAQIDAKIMAWNEHSISDAATRFRDMTKLDDELKELKKDYNKISLKLTFEKLNGSMLEAIKLNRYPVASWKDVGESGSTVKTRVREDGDAQFDLYDFDVYNGSIASHDKKWVRMAENFNMLCCMKAASDIGVKDFSKISDDYFMSKMAVQAKLAGQDASVANPISNTQMLKWLQDVVDAIVYEDKDGKNAYKVLTYDVNWMERVYGQKDKRNKLTMKVAKHKDFRLILSDVLHRIVTGTSYKVAYQTQK